MNPLFDGALADGLVDEDGLGLADAVGAVRCLGLGGGFPPGVVVDDDRLSPVPPALSEMTKTGGFAGLEALDDPTLNLFSAD